MEVGSITMSRTQVAIVGAGPCRRSTCWRGRHRLRRARKPFPRVRRAAGAGRRAGAGHRRSALRTGVGERLKREGLVHHGIELRFDGASHRIPLTELTGGRSIMVYGQQEVVKDLIQARLEPAARSCFEAGATSASHDLDSTSPDRALPATTARRRATGRLRGRLRRLPRRLPRRHPSRRADRVTSTTYPFAWLGILAAAPPVHRGVIYAYNERGFALHSMRSPEVSRLYLQCGQTKASTTGPTSASGRSSGARLATRRRRRADARPDPREGHHRDAQLRRRADAARPAVPGRRRRPHRAADRRQGDEPRHRRRRASWPRRCAWYRPAAPTLLDGYSATCLRRVWRAEHFSWWMTSMLHRFEDDAASSSDSSSRSCGTSVSSTGGGRLAGRELRRAGDRLTLTYRAESGTAGAPLGRSAPTR